jgi:HEAT repeat protein
LEPVEHGDHAVVREERRSKGRLATIALCVSAAIGAPALEAGRQAPGGQDRISTSAEALERLNDPDWRVRLSGVMWLYQHGSEIPGAVEALVERSHDENEEVRRWSAYALGEAGRSAALAIPPLVEMLSARSASERTAAARALQELGTPPQAIPGLLASASEPDHGVGAREAAIEALARAEPSDEIVLRFVSLLADSSPLVAGAAHKALLGLGPRASAAVPALVERIERPGSRARVAAADVLGHIGPAAGPAVPALFGLLEDDDSRVRETAAEAIRSIRSGPRGPS